MQLKNGMTNEICTIRNESVIFYLHLKNQKKVKKEWFLIIFKAKGEEIFFMQSRISKCKKEDKMEEFFSRCTCNNGRKYLYIAYFKFNQLMTTNLFSWLTFDAFFLFLLFAVCFLYSLSLIEIFTLSYFNKSLNSFLLILFFRQRCRQVLFLISLHLFCFVCSFYFYILFPIFAFSFVFRYVVFFTCFHFSTPRHLAMYLFKL